MESQPAPPPPPRDSTGTPSHSPPAARSGSAKPTLIRQLRRAHRHLGVFFAPLLLFFVLTGWYQTVTPDRRKGVADSDDWISRLTRVHVEQYYPAKSAESYSTRLFSALVVVLSIALCLTVLLGILLAFLGSKAPWAVWLSLTLGIVVPLLALWLGQKR